MSATTASATASRRGPAADDDHDEAAEEPKGTGAKGKAGTKRRPPAAPVFSHAEDAADDDEPVEDVDPQTVATELLLRALQIGHAKGDADEWLNTGAVKNQMRRMDPSFNEKPLGYRSFTDFLASRDDVAELDEDGPQRLIRLRPAAPAKGSRRR